MKAFLNLIRWKNLLIVIATMVLMRYAVLEPLLSRMSTVFKADQTQSVFMQLQLPLINFILLVIATVLLTAGGYVINDYFDIKTDLINRGKVIVGTKIPRRHAISWHFVLNAIGIIIGFYISWKAGYLMLGTLFIIVSGLLYFYSASYKRQFLVGNLIVAALAAAVPMLVAVYEWPALYRYYAPRAYEVPDFSFIWWWTGGFAVFAFLTTLAREIIKDVEDFEGDMAYGRNTLPVVLGIKGSRIVSVVIVAGIIALLYAAWFFYVNDTITLIYISVALALPMLFVIYRLLKSQSKEHLHQASSLMKAVMVMGILYSVVVKIILTWNLL